MPRMQAEVAIHLGAHKTATTHLQAYLGRNRAFLEQHGIAYRGPRDVGSIYKDPARSGAGRLFRLAPRGGLRTLLQSELKTFERIIVSDENLIGNSRTNLKTRSLYHDARKRTQEAVKGFRAGKVTAFLAVRCYSNFFASAYAEQLRWARIIGFGPAKAALLRSDRAWPDVVNDVCEVVGSRNVRLWRYEDYRDQHEPVAAALVCRQLPGSFAPPPNGANDGLSSQAVERIEKLDTTVPQEDWRRMIRDIETSYPRAKYPAFDPWEPHERAALKARYARDIERLRHEHPDIWVLNPILGRQ